MFARNAGIIAGLLLLSLTACTAFRTIRDPAAYLTTHNPPRIRVTTGNHSANHSAVLMEAPTLHGDTLGGIVKGQYGEMSMSNVVLVEVRQPAPRRTALLLAAGVSAAAVAVVASEKGCDDHGLVAAMVCYDAAETYVVPCPGTGQCFKPYPL